MFALVKTYGKKFSRQVACFVHVLHLPQKHLWQVKFLRTLRLFALLQTDGKSFKASCSLCSRFTFATKAPLAGEISADVAFVCLVAKINGIKRSTQLAHTAIVATSTAILLPLVRFKSWQKNNTILSNCAETYNGMQSIIKNFQQKSNPKRLLLFLFTSLCTAPTLHLPR